MKKKKEKYGEKVGFLVFLCVPFFLGVFCVFMFFLFFSSYFVVSSVSYAFSIFLSYDFPMLFLVFPHFLEFFWGFLCFPICFPMFFPMFFLFFSRFFGCVLCFPIFPMLFPICFLFFPVERHKYILSDRVNYSISTISQFLK